MEDQTSSAGPLVRRVVTANREDGKARFLFDDRDGNVLTLPNGTRFQYLWWTDEVPMELNETDNADPTKGPINFQFSNRGTVGVMTWMKAGCSFPFHLTNSIDYGVVLEGEVQLELDSGEKTILRTGDVSIQRQTNHKWNNIHPTAWVKVFFVLVASKSAFNLQGA